METLAELTKLAQEILTEELEAITGKGIQITINVHNVPVSYFPDKSRTVVIGPGKSLKAFTVGDTIFF